MVQKIIDGATHMRAYFVLGSPTTSRDRKSEVSIITAAAAALMIVKRKNAVRLV